jgi:hypothetical protein
VVVALKVRLTARSKASSDHVTGVAEPTQLEVVEEGRGSGSGMSGRMLASGRAGLKMAHGAAAGEVKG